MIVIDGRESALSLANYANLEEILTTLMQEEKLEERIVTDVLVNKEAFSELYPHQAEDIDAQDITHLEVRTVSMDEMASDVVRELPKVVCLMADGSRRVAGLLRQAELAEALEVMQDVIFVSRDFLNTIQVLRSSYTPQVSRDLDALGESLGGLLGEIADIMANEDWMLVADLLEYEYIPACEGWRAVIDRLAAAIAESHRN